MEENDYDNLKLEYEDCIPIRSLGILGEIPKPEKILYGINEQYFETIKALIDYCREKYFSTEFVKHCSYKVSYIRNYAGCADVFLKTFNKDYENPIRNSSSLLLTAIDGEVYGVYNFYKSIEKNGFIWDCKEGSLRSMHNAFRERNIEFVNDIYLNIDENKEKTYKLYKK